MHVDSIRYFRATFETGSLREASTILKITPGTLSKSIQQLEKKLGIKLFTQSGRRIFPTKAAQRLYASSYRFIEEYNGLFASVRNEDEFTQPLRIGTFEVFSTYFIAEILKMEPTIGRLTLIELAPGEIEKAVLQGSIDLGITYVPYPSDKIDHLKIGIIEFGLFSRPGKFDDSKFSNIPFAIPIVSLEGTPLEIDGLDSWKRSNPTRSAFFKFELLQTALQTTSLGLSAIFCPRFVVKLYNGYVKKEYELAEMQGALIGKPVTQHVYLVKRKDRLEERLFKKIAAAMRRICRG